MAARAGIGPWQIKKPRPLRLNDGWLLAKIEPAQLPSGIRRTRIYGFTEHCPISFTLRRFIGRLASEKAGCSEYDVNDRSSVPMGAFLAVIAGPSCRGRTPVMAPSPETRHLDGGPLGRFE